MKTDPALEAVYALTAKRARVLSEKEDAIEAAVEAAAAPFNKRLAEIDAAMIEACRQVAERASAPLDAVSHVNGETHSRVTDSTVSHVNGSAHSHATAPVHEADTQDEAVSKSDQVFRLVQLHPRGEVIDYGIAATKIYGADNETTRKRLRSALNFLQGEGKIRHAGRNRWVVVASVQEDFTDDLDDDLDGPINAAAS